MTTRWNIAGVAKWLVGHPACFFLLWSLWLSAESICLGPLSYVPVADVGETNLPARLAASWAFHAGEFSFWNPMGNAGADRLAMALQNKSDLLLFFMLPGWLAHGLILWLQRFVAGYFMLRLLRDRLRVPSVPALYGGIVYAIFSQPAINQQWMGFTLYDGLALPALPLILWALGRIEDNGARGLLAAGSLGMGYSLVSHYFLTVFILPVILLWFLLVDRRPPRFLRVLAVFAAGWLIVEIPLLWASFTHAPFSHRKAWTVETVISGNALSIGLGAFDLVAALMRDNAVPILSALAGLVLCRGKDRTLVALVGLLVFCAAYVAGEILFLGGLLYQWGVLPGFNFTRLYILIPFLAAVAGSLGLARIPESWRVAVSDGSTPTRSMVLQTTVCVVLMGLVGWHSLQIKKDAIAGIADGQNYFACYLNPALDELSRVVPSRTPFRIATLTGLAPSDSRAGYVWPRGWQSADGYLPLFPGRYHAFWTTVISPLANHDPEGFERFRERGSRVYLYLPQGRGATGDPARLGSYADRELLSLVNVRYIISSVPLDDPDLKPIAMPRLDDQLRWSALSRRERLLGMLVSDYPGTPRYVYENKEALPRFFLAGNVRLFDTPTELLAEMAAAPLGDLRATAFLLRSEAGGLEPATTASSSGEVRIERSSPDRIILRTSAPSDRVLIATNCFSPGWQVHIDGKPGHIFPAQHTFQGVFVPRGSHEVVLSYSPPRCRIPVGEGGSAAWFTRLSAGLSH